MRLRDYMDAFNKSLRANPRKKVEIPNIAEISRRAALGETWAKLAFESGVSPYIIALRVREYRYDNFTTDAVLEDIRFERDSGKDWLELGTRAGWPTEKGMMERFATEFNRLMNERVESETIKKKRGGGRPKKVLKASAYDDYRTGRKTIYEIADENEMSVVTARKRLLELAGPDVTDLKSIVLKEPDIDPEEAEDIVEELVEDVEEAVESNGIVAHGNIPKGFWDRELILQFLYDEETEKEEVMRAFGLTAGELDILVAIDIYPSGRIRALEELISDSSSAIDDLITASVPDVSYAVEMRTTPKRLPKMPTPDPEPVTIESVLPYFSKPKVQPGKKRRGRKKKVYNFTDAERAFIRDAYYEEKKYVWLIADILTKERGENVTQTAVKQIIADYSQGRGRRSKLDRSALKQDAKRNLAVSTLAEMHNVSGPTIANALREMGIKPIYSLSKEAMLRKPSEEEIAEQQAKFDEVQLQIDLILNDPVRRQSVKEAYLRSNLASENDVAVLAAREGISTYNMAHVLTDIFDAEIQRIQGRDRIDELVSEYDADQLRKIQRDLIDRRTLQLRGNPYDENAVRRYVVPGAQGTAAGIIVDQAVRYFYPMVSQNRRNLTSGALLVGVCAVDYMHEKDEAKIWRAAGGVAGVLISRLIESKFQK